MSRPRPNEDSETRSTPVTVPQESPISQARRLFDRVPPQEYLEEWSERLARNAEPPPSPTTSVLIFRIGGEWLAVNTADLVEVTNVQPIQTIPHRSEATLRGLTNIRGSLQLCVGLDKVLGIDPDIDPSADRSTPESSSEGRRMVILNDPSGPWVFVASEVLGIRQIDHEQLRQVPATFPQATSLSQAVFTWEDQTVGLLDAARLFTVLRERCA